MTIRVRKSLLDGLKVLDLDKLTPVAFFDGKLIGIDRFGYGMHGEVFAVDLATGEWAQFTDDGHPKNSAAMSADYLAWTNGRGHEGGGPNDIFVRDLRTGQESRITEEPASRDGLQISGSRLVWHEDRNLQERGADIYAYDLESDELLQVAVGQPVSRSWPKVDGDIVVWADDRAERFHIYMHDLATGSERLLAEAWAHYPRPTIEGRLVTWEAAEGIVQLDIDTGQRRTILSLSQKSELAMGCR